jgi:hypothetical protein
MQRQFKVIPVQLFEPLISKIKNGNTDVKPERVKLTSVTLRKDLKGFTGVNYLARVKIYYPIKYKNKIITILFNNEHVSEYYNKYSELIEDDNYTPEQVAYILFKHNFRDVLD